MLLLGFGNPLLDLTAQVPPAFLARHGLYPQDAVAALPLHASLAEEVRREFPVTTTAGGSAQNTIRVAQWMLNKIMGTQAIGKSAFIGAVGVDALGEILEACLISDGVIPHYSKINGKLTTGNCLSLITPQGRSLISNVGIAASFSASFLKTSFLTAILDSVRYFYFEAFFICTSMDSVVHIGEYVVSNNKVFIVSCFVFYFWIFDFF
jgi:adenosine kinase